MQEKIMKINLLLSAAFLAISASGFNSMHAAGEVEKPEIAQMRKANHDMQAQIVALTDQVARLTEQLAHFQVLAVPAPAHHALSAHAASSAEYCPNECYGAEAAAATAEPFEYQHHQQEMSPVAAVSSHGSAQSQHGDNLNQVHINSIRQAAKHAVTFFIDELMQQDDQFLISVVAAKPANTRNAFKNALFNVIENAPVDATFHQDADIKFCISEKLSPVN